MKPLADLRSYQHIYFIGIGGIGMSALARFFISKGKQVSGYDLTKTKLTQNLEAAGITIHYEDSIENIPKDIDLVVYTPAIPKSHKEFVFLQASDLPVIKRSKALGMLSEEMDCIAIAGTHGKTSTSAIVAHLLADAAWSPTAFVGGILKNYQTNYLEGTSNWFVVEADEYDRSFLHLYPKIAVIQSMDPDHLDIYGDHETMIAAYEQFSLQVKEGGTLILQSGLSLLFSETWRESLRKKKIHLIELGTKGYAFSKIQIKNHRYQFDLQAFTTYFAGIPSTMPGLHNVKNAAAAILAVLMAGVSAKEIIRGMTSFEGIKRRFEWIYEGEGFTLIDDYAHHPTELEAAISTAKALYPEKEISAVFQPHLFSRTKDFYVEFAEQLSRLDRVYLMPIYPARELPMEGISSEMIFDIIKNNNGYSIGFQQLIPKLRLNKPEILLTLGASDLDKYHDSIIEVLKD